MLQSVVAVKGESESESEKRKRKAKSETGRDAVEGYAQMTSPARLE